MTGGGSGNVWSAAAPLGGYCERTGDAFWAEPLNALSNGIFLLAALAVFVRARRGGCRDAGLYTLIAITVGIGVGSFLFHTLASRWAALADVVPILLFIVAYLMLVCHRWLAFAWPWAIAAGLAYAPLSVGARLLWREIVGGSGAPGAYLPALLVLLICAGLLARRHHPAARHLAAASALFALSLAVRSLDLPLCPLVPTGTHFLWHLLNGGLLYGLMRTMLRYGPVAPPAKPKVQNPDSEVSDETHHVVFTPDQVSRPPERAADDLYAGGGDDSGLDHQRPLL